MKTLYSITITICLLLFGGCNVLDTEDLSNYGPNVWNDEILVSAYLTNLYAETFTGWPTDGDTSDECIGIYGKDAVQPNNDAFKYWPYQNIRSVNILLKNIKTGTLSVKTQEPIIGQTLFLRAFLYFKMVRLYGGVPIIKEPQEIEDDLNVSRNSTAECFDFILNDLDEAAKLVPVKYTGDNYGRIDQCVIAAFKSRVCLYKASPQFNPSQPYTNPYWKESRDAAEAAYKLLNANGYGLVDDYTSVFETKRHKEAILAVIYNNPDKTNGRKEDYVRPLSESKNMTGGDQPTWGLVEAFPMKDGKKAGESKYSYNMQTFWENRDPRFDATVVYNGDIYELSGKAGRRQYTAPNIASSLDAFGYNIQGEHNSRTGLFCKKGIMEQLPVAQVTLNDVDWLEIRYPEILFNYAESENETGNSAIGYDVLKAIRKRAGIEAGDDNMYGVEAGMTKEEMRMALLDEKRIEFSFEGQRFWDLRRYRLLHTYLNGQHKYGILATLKSSINPTDAMNRAANYTLMPNDFNYKAEDLIFQNPTGEAAMYMPESYYFFPISKTELDKNPNLKQNKDWGGSFEPQL